MTIGINVKIHLLYERVDQHKKNATPAGTAFCIIIKPESLKG